MDTNNESTTVEMGVTLYNMNKSLSLNEAPLTQQEIKTKLNQYMIPFIKSYNDNYFMLLCRERYDFTLFNFIKKKENNLIQSVEDMFECLFNRGKVTYIEPTENNSALEIWITIEEEAFVFYFFPYDLGVIEVDI